MFLYRGYEVVKIKLFAVCRTCSLKITDRGPTTTNFVRLEQRRIHRNPFWGHGVTGACSSHCLGKAGYTPDRSVFWRAAKLNYIFGKISELKDAHWFHIKLSDISHWFCLAVIAILVKNKKTIVKSKFFVHWNFESTPLLVQIADILWLTLLSLLLVNHTK